MSASSAGGAGTSRSTTTEATAPSSRTAVVPASGRTKIPSGGRSDMSLSFNLVVLAGRVGKDPELRYTTAGKAVASFSLAVDDSYGEQKHVSWFNCVCFGATAENVKKY